VDPLARLDGARIVISGGRGMGGAEGFALLQALALELGSRLGGACRRCRPQHSGTWGIAPRSRIVAVNSDPDADIFRYAAVGVVAKWQDLVPRALQAGAGLDESQGRTQ
jgi:electron transfer flavoprotein alpha subunit